MKRKYNYQWVGHAVHGKLSIYQTIHSEEKYYVMNAYLYTSYLRFRNLAAVFPKAILEV